MPNPLITQLCFWTIVCLLLGFSIAAAPYPHASAQVTSLDKELQAVLREAGFTGWMESTREHRLGRRLDLPLADLGRNLWFDTLTGLNNDNACAGCHSPTAGFGDTQSIPIGIDSNKGVGTHRAGPRNTRRAPMVITS